LFLVFLVVQLISITPHAFAIDKNSILEMPYTDNPSLIDGKWSTADEWKGAGEAKIQTDHGTAYLFVKHDRDNIYFMVDDPNYLQPFGSVYAFFDTSNGASNSLSKEDFALMFGQSEAGVVNIHDFDRGNSEGKWDRMELPSKIQMSSSLSSTNDPYESGRDHLIFEFSMPLSFLHKQDQYGFAVVLYENLAGGKTAGPVGMWPTYNLLTPSTIFYSLFPAYGGILEDKNNQVTAPPVPVISVSEQSLSFGNEEVSGKNSKAVTISNSGTGILKISNIRVPDEFSISGLTIPTDVPPMQSVSFNIIFAPLSTGDKSGNVIISSNDLSNPDYSLSVSGTSVEKGKSPFGGKCLIATAAFGSELSPQVQFLRGFRDNHILATESGSSFMNVFNAWYYSFSPYVADYERQQPWLQQIVKTSIYPLLGILTLSEKGFSTVQGDYGAVIAGSIASSMIGAVYFWPLALAAPQVRNGTRFNYKLAATAFAVVSAATVFSIIVGNEIALMITTSLFVLTLVGIFATISAKIIVTAVKKFV
jgi:hypothetical protein